MTTKEKPTTIYAAFIKAQSEFGPALKTANNPFFKSRYADLASCVDAVLDALNKNGIGLIQKCHECADGVLVETVMIHSSGETIECGKLHVPAGKQNAQEYGSALTYARRYSLMASCMIAPEDDDGNAATTGSQTAKKKDVDAFERIVKATVKILLDSHENSDEETFRKTVENIEEPHKKAIWDKLPSNVRVTIQKLKAAKAGTNEGEVKE